MGTAGIVREVAVQTGVEGLPADLCTPRGDVGGGEGRGEAERGPGSGTHCQAVNQHVSSN